MLCTKITYFVSIRSIRLEREVFFEYAFKGIIGTIVKLFLMYVIYILNLCISLFLFSVMIRFSEVENIISNALS